MKSDVVIGGDLELTSQIDGETAIEINADGNGSSGTVPSSFVGDDVPRRGANDLTVEIQDYRSTRPMPITFKSHSISSEDGYYPDGAIKYNPFGEMETNEATSVEIDNEGTATIQFSPSKHGMAYEVGDYTLTKTNAVNIFASTDVTPTKDPIILATQDRYCISNTTILPIPEQYEIYNWMGSQAEFVSEVYSVHEFTLKSTSFNGWTPSTTAKTIKSALSPTTFVADMANYEYMLKWYCECDLVYSTGYTDVARTIRVASVICQVICKRPNSLANIAASNFAGNACVTYRTSPLMEYWNNNGSHTYTYGASYGVYPAATAATFSNSTADNPTVTVKTPAWSARCSTTYFSTSNAGYIDQVNSKIRMKGELYRMKIGSPERNMLNDLIALYNTPLETS